MPPPVRTPALPQDLATYWQFNDPEQNGLARETLAARDASGRGNDLRLVTLPRASTQTIERVGLWRSRWPQLAVACPAANGQLLPIEGQLRAGGREMVICCWIAGRPACLVVPHSVEASACCPLHDWPVLAARPLHLQGSQRFESGALTFRNNYAMQQAYQGMPDRWGPTLAALAMSEWLHGAGLRIAGSSRSRGAHLCATSATRAAWKAAPPHT